MVVLADSSAWIDFFNDIDAPWTESLGKVASRGDIIVGDLVLAEVLQGLRPDKEFQAINSILAGFLQMDLCGGHIAPLAAANYRLLRSRGITVRGTIDVIIATWCIENDVRIIHNERDMAVMEDALGLVAYR